MVQILVRSLRRTLARVRNGVERLLHPRRHRVAREAVQARAPVRHVVFLCLGNICRSPYAEARLREQLALVGLADHVRTESAGLLGPGRPAPAAAREVARERGLDLQAHRSKALDRSHLQGADLIVVMTNDQRRRLRGRYRRRDAIHLGDLDPGPISRRDIRDPVEQPPEVFRRVYDRIDRAVEVLAAELIRQASIPSGWPTGPPGSTGAG